MLIFLLKIIKHPFIFVGVASAVLLLAMIFLFLKRKMGLVAFLVSLTVFMLSILNFIVGNRLFGYWINQYGQIGMATVISQESTNITYNERQVIRYNVLIKTEASQEVESYFLSSDFNIYPLPKGAYVYPTIGQAFRVKYMEGDPNLFVILIESEGDYVKSRHCDQIIQNLNATVAKLALSPENEDFRDEFNFALEAYKVDNCYTNQATLEYYQATFERLEVKTRE